MTTSISGSLLLRCLGLWLLSGSLHWRLHHLVHVGLSTHLLLLSLLHKKLVDLVHVLVQEVGIAHKGLELCNTVEETSGNLAGHFAVNVLNREVNGVTDKLELLVAVNDAVKFLKIYLGEANALDLWLLLGRRHARRVLLLRKRLREVGLVHDGCVVLGRSSVILPEVLAGSLISVLVIITLTAASVVTTSSISALSSSTVLLVGSLLIVIVSGLESTLRLVSISSLHATTHRLLLHIHLLLTLIFAVTEPVEHFSLLLSKSLVFELLL